MSQLLRKGAVAADVLRNFLTVATTSGVTVRSLTLAGRRTMAWYPRRPQGLLPLVLFSHGYGGANLQSNSLMTRLAEAGFLVLAPNHADAASWAGGIGKSRPQASFGRPESWTDESYRDRFEDFLAVHAAIGSDPFLRSLHDGGPVILAGHSLGGYTVLGMSGARKGWKNGIEPAAVVAFSPYLAPYLGAGSLSGLTAPVMYQGGTADLGITPAVARAGGGYDQSPAPKYFVSLEGAGHLAWTELQCEQHPVITRYLVAFCNRYSGRETDRELERKAAGVAQLRFAV